MLYYIRVKTDISGTSQTQLSHTHTHTLSIDGNQVLSCSKMVIFNINIPCRFKIKIILCLLS